MSPAMNDSSFIEKMVDKFYEYMSAMFIEYYQLPEKPQIPIERNSTKSANQDANHDANCEEVTVNADAVIEEYHTREQSFPEYFLYKLYYNYGIKRRMVNEHIALLFYVKNLKGYKTEEYITMLCRHMMIDLRNMRIISLGIPKAMKLDAFCEELSINKEDESSNIAQDGQAKYQVFKFPEGTMITYNPSLAKYNVAAVTTDANNDTTNEGTNEGTNETNAYGTNTGSEDREALKQELANAELINQNIAQQFAQQMQFSTRKVVGTGRFSSLKTFLEMFNENNEIANTNLGLIPVDYIANKVMVFNIEHPENRVISLQTRNYNTLCSVYQFKTDSEVTEQYHLLLELISNHTGGSMCDDLLNQVKETFVRLGSGMVTQCNLKEVRDELEEFGVQVRLPDAVKSFGNSRAGIISSEHMSIVVEKLSLVQLENIVQSRPKDFQGYILYSTNGARSKIMNSQYKELKMLKGNKPIVIEQWNTKNLFYLYWRLVKLQMIPQFIAEFDASGGWSYNQIFYWFASLAHGYSVNLFRVYHNSFVKKTMDRYNIPYSMKPMCGDLHNMYKANKTPISQSMVEQYVFQQGAGKMFWRLFSGK
jgi:hypothetical protein